MRDKQNETIYSIPQKGYIDHVDMNVFDPYFDNHNVRLRQFTDWEYKQNKDGSYDLVLHNGVLSIDDNE